LTIFFDYQNISAICVCSTLLHIFSPQTVATSQEKRRNSGLDKPVSHHYHSRSSFHLFSVALVEQAYRKACETTHQKALHSW